MIKRRLARGVVVALTSIALPLAMPFAVYAEEVDKASDIESVQVATFAELLAAFDATYEAESGSKKIVLTSDIAQTYGKEDYLGVNRGWEVILDLAGHILTLRNDGPRGLSNEGTLTITGDGTVTNGDTMNESYGLVDNLGGTVVVENGTFIDYGQGGGAAFKNRVVKDTDTNEEYEGSMVIKGGLIESRATAGGNACIYSDGVLAVGDGVEIMNLATDEVHGDWFGSYAVTVNSGSAMFGSSIGGTESIVDISGNRGGLAVNSGYVVINNGRFSGNIWYGIWITNNGDASEVDIKYAEVDGGRYGIYSTVDDGKQDLSDVQIKIEDGRYSGGTKAAVAVNASGSEHSWGMQLSGGIYSTEPDDSYIADGYVAAMTGEEDYPFMVLSPTDETDEHDVEYVEDGETGEEVPVVAPAKVDYGAEDAAPIISGGNAGEIEGEIAFNEEFIADRKAYLEIIDTTDGASVVVGDNSETETGLIGVFEITLKDRNGVEIPVEGKSINLKVRLTEAQYNALSEYDEVKVIYFNDGAEQERLDATISEAVYDGSSLAYYLEFNAEHLSTYGVAGVRATEPEPAIANGVDATSAPDTGALTEPLDEFAVVSAEAQSSKIDYSGLIATVVVLTFVTVTMEIVMYRRANRRK